MSKRQKKSVSEIVEKYKTEYPQAERKLLRRLIRLKYPEINSRTLDRHLKKAYADSFVPIVKELKKKWNVEEIRSEMKKIRDDYVQGRIRQASERTYLLWGMLPIDWHKEVESVFLASRRWREETFNEAGLDPNVDHTGLDLILFPNEITEILVKLNQLLESCE